jgi:hypothetical protein
VRFAVPEPESPPPNATEPPVTLMVSAPILPAITSEVTAPGAKFSVKGFSQFPPACSGHYL